MVPGAFQIQTDIVHSGHAAAQITVHANDRYEGPGDNHSNPSERDELTEDQKLFSHAGHTYTYRFSQYLPVDFPILDDRLVIAQWKQLCEHGDCKPDNPVLAFRYTNGIFKIDHRDDSGSHPLYQTSQELRGQWLNFRVNHPLHADRLRPDRHLAQRPADRPRIAASPPMGFAMATPQTVASTLRWASTAIASPSP